MFRALDSANFLPFGKFRMDFPPIEKKPADLAEVHLLTGVNGTGKTRLLTVLAAMLGNGAPLQKRMKGVAQDQAANIRATDAALDRGGLLTNPSLLIAHQGSVGWRIFGQIAQWCHDVPAFAYDGAAYVSDANIAVMAGMPKPDR